MYHQKGNKQLEDYKQHLINKLQNDNLCEEEFIVIQTFIDNFELITNSKETSILKEEHSNKN